MLVQSMFHPGVEGHILLYFETTWIEPSYRRVISIKKSVAIAHCLLNPKKASGIQINIDPKFSAIPETDKLV